MKKIFIFITTILLIFCRNSYCQENAKTSMEKDLIILKSAINSIADKLDSAKVVSQIDVTTIPVYENKYEYKIISPKIQVFGEDLFNKEGEDGWILASAIESKNGFYKLIFYRKKRTEKLIFE